MKRERLLTIMQILIPAILAAIPVNISCQAGSDGSTTQYLFPEFSNSVTRMKSGKALTYQMNYNIVTEKMVFVREGKYFDLTNPEMVDTITIYGSTFVPVSKIFYELLHPGTMTLYLRHKGELLPAGKQVGYGGTSQVASTSYLSSIKLSGGEYNLPLPPEYIIKPIPSFFIKKNGEMLEFQTEKQFLKLFPDKSDLIKSYIKENRIKFEKMEHLIRLVDYCSSLQ